MCGPETRLQYSFPIKFCLTSYGIHIVYNSTVNISKYQLSLHFLSQWPWTPHMWGVKGVIMGEWPWNLAGVCVLCTCIYVSSFKALWLTVFEKTHWGVKDLWWLDFLQIFIWVIKSLSSCISTNMFWIAFLCLLMTGVNKFWMKLHINW